MMNPIETDPVIDEIRDVRHRLSANFGHDPAKLVEFLMQYQRQFHDRLVYDPDQNAAQQDTEPERNQTGQLSAS